MTNDEMNAFVRQHLKSSGVSTSEYWSVWDEDCIQLDGDFSLVELEAFCAALRALQTNKFLLVYLRYHSWEFASFFGFEEAVAEAIQGQYDGTFSPVAIADTASGELKIINALIASNIGYECKEFLLEKTGRSFTVSERVDLDDLWREMSKKKEEA